MQDKTDWSLFDIKARTDEESWLVTRAAYVTQIYGDPEFAANAHELLDYWLAARGDATGLEVINAKSTSPVPLTAPGLKRVRTALQNGKSKLTYFWINAAPGFDAGAWSIEFKLWPQAPNNSSCVQIRMPPTVVETEEPAKLIADFKKLAARPGVWHASAGLGLYLVFGSDWAQFAGAKLFALTKRFLALDLPNRSTEPYLLKQTKGPNWLTYVGDELAGTLAARPSANEPGFSVEPLGDGKLLIAGKRAPLGDVNRGAKDLGPLRVAARMLKPLRTTQWMNIPRPLEHFDLDSTTWLSRLDSDDE